MQKPQQGEYENEYLKFYIDAVPGDDAIASLKSLTGTTKETLQSIDEAKANYAYSEGKWSVKEVLGHIIDTERVFMYRAFCISRGEQQSLPGFDQDEYVENGRYAEKTIADILEEYSAVRQATLMFCKNLTGSDLDRSGFANGKRINVRSLLFACAGHEIHHVNVLKSKYGI